MSHSYSDDQIQQALQNCEDEPVHIPGRVQHFGWLLAYSVAAHEVMYASENAADGLGIPVEDILGQQVKDLLGREIWHGLQNHLATGTAADRRFVVGSWQASDDGAAYLVATWQSGDFIVVEFEMLPEAPLFSATELQAQSSLVDQVQRTTDVQSLLDLMTKQLRHLTGFDRVMVYQFDQHWNGEVISESHVRKMEPFLGLNFPSFDIPAQARAIMARIPLRLIADVDATDVPIRAVNADLPPLDISLAESRGTSPVHLEYLRNMGVKSTMTLSIVVEGSLWGIISFHHTQPRVASASLRMVLRGFLDVFCLKLSLLTERKLKILSEEVDQLQEELFALTNTDPTLSELLEALHHRLEETFQACGIYIKSEQGEYSAGVTPSQEWITKLVQGLPGNSTAPYFTDSLPRDILGMNAPIAPIAGAAVLNYASEWMLIIFRAETNQSVSWAGNPEKTIEVAEGRVRLTPRGSFDAFLAQTRGQSKPWTAEDRTLAKKLWPLLSAALNSEQKRRYMKDLSRQQELMIDELNHRVRNILALVQSVSTEAKKSQSSLASYSTAIEARIRALGAAHSIGSGSSAKKVDIAEIILQEAKPYENENNTRVRVMGERMAIVPDLAPIFALAIHELMTNAAKYGALSNTVGRVAINMRLVDGDLEITWQETDGPVVPTPIRTGFGTTLVKRAIPYELDGTSSIIFEPEGVQAILHLPESILMTSDADDVSSYNQPQFGTGDVTGPVMPNNLTDGLALILEDNFMIAEGMTQQLKDLGFTNIEAASSLAAALELLESETPSFAILDVNLGHGKTSLLVAEVLLERKVPFLFATGYGELSSMPPRLTKQIVLTKPIDKLELANAIARIEG